MMFTMRSFFPAALFLASAVIGAPNNFGRSTVPANSSLPGRCGLMISDDQLAAAEESFRSEKVLFKNNTLVKAGSLQLHFHVIAANQTYQGGWLSPAAIEAQVAVLNKDFAPTGIQWTLASVDNIMEPIWFSSVGPSNTYDADMKMKMKRGDVTDLNVYTVGFTSSSTTGLLGYATLPSSYANDPSSDGVVILYSSLPGGNLQSYNLGHSLTHEVGHWVGLYHTFQGGCSDSGDFVDDTPAEAVPSQGCPVNRNTCPSPGADPIHNYMDYSYDACMSQFTQGQISRMKAQIGIYRSIIA